MMRQLISDHKVPVGVTAAGLLAVLGLATAPVIMAESESEILTRKNASEIASITEALEASAARLQEDFESRSANLAKAIASIENQISILNKATSRIHSRQVDILKPSGEIRSSITSLESNAELRMSNIERAITQLHLAQREFATQPTVTPASLADPEATNLAVAAQGVIKTEPAQEGEVRTRVAVTEDAAILKERIAVLEREVRLSRVERSLTRLGQRLESIEGSGGEKAQVNVQLRDIKSYIDGLLVELEP